MNAQTKSVPATRQVIETVKSTALFGSATTLNIDHQGMTYTLRITRQGKWLLTK